MIRNGRKSSLVAVGFLVLMLSGCSREPLNLDITAEWEKLSLGNIESTFKLNRYLRNKELNNVLTEDVHKKIGESIDRVINVTLGDREKTYNLKDCAVIDGVTYDMGGKTFLYQEGDQKLVRFLHDGIKLIDNINVSKHYEYEDELSSLLEEAKEFNKASSRPKYSFNSGSFSVSESSKTGVSANVSKLESEFTSLVNSNSSGDITLDLVETYPDINDEQLLSINKRLATFSTGFNPGGSRGINIKIATRNINGALVAPGETISIDKLMKSRNKANGYMPAGSYLNGKTVQTYGGGICQVSTTLYGAILRAGIIPVERNAHSMSVSYVPLGLDAAISEGYKDLKIKNTYDLPIYIQGVVNGGTVTFNIYGNESLLDGYTYKPISTSNKSSLQADSWLQKIKDGNVVEKIHLFKSNYRLHE